jgi:hypothetical protein
MTGRRGETVRVLVVCIALILIPAVTLVACSGRGDPNAPFECTHPRERPTLLASSSKSWR